MKNRNIWQISSFFSLGCRFFALRDDFVNPTHVRVYVIAVPLLNCTNILLGNCGQNNRRVTFLTPASGFYLEGHVISNHSVELNLDCQDQCVLAKECVSYNIGPNINNKMACELGNSDHLQHPEDLKPRKDWIYRGTQVWLTINVYGLA